MVVQFVVPPFRRHFSNAIAALLEISPELLHIFGLRISSAEPDDSDVFAGTDWGAEVAILTAHCRGWPSSSRRGLISIFRFGLFSQDAYCFLHDSRMRFDEIFSESSNGLVFEKQRLGERA